MRNKSIIKKAFAATLPVLAGYAVLGIGFGIILKIKGFGVLLAASMSIFIYAGSMQYLAIDMLTGGASLVAAALTTLMVNARHLFYGISMVDKYKGTGRAKPYLIFALTDETYSILCNEPQPKSIEERKYFVAVSALNQMYWVAGTVIGSFLGSVVSFNTEGIDFALTALFVTVFTEQWLGGGEHDSALVGLIGSLLCLIVFGSDSFLIPAMLLITLALTLMRRRKEART